MKVLLDTNVYSALRRGHSGFEERVREAQRILFSTVVLGELEHGFRSGSRYVENRRHLDAFLDHPYVVIVPVSRTTADRFGRIAANLRKQGRPIPSNDIWIAAHAMETGAELLSLDRHFEAVNGLALWNVPAS